jgi:hypothetical protein
MISNNNNNFLTHKKIEKILKNIKSYLQVNSHPKSLKIKVLSRSL